MRTIRSDGLTWPGNTKDLDVLNQVKSLRPDDAMPKFWEVSH